MPQQVLLFFDDFIARRFIGNAFLRTATSILALLLINSRVDLVLKVKFKACILFLVLSLESVPNPFEPSPVNIHSLGI